MMFKDEDNKEEYNNWLNWLEQHKEVLNSWEPCGSKCGSLYDDCGCCLRGLYDIDDNVGFLDKVKYFVENVVEELCMYPKWTEKELNERGREMGYLVDLYFKYRM